MAAPTSPISFDQLLAHRAWLQRLARGLAKDMGTADDLEQEVWLRALRAPPRRRGSLRGWLATVLRNTARDRHRRESRRGAPVEAMGKGHAESADALAIRAETHERVTRAVLALDEPYRSAVLLRYVGDKPVAVVAHELGVPVETVRTRLRRAREQLRVRLDEAHGGSRGAWQAALAPLLTGAVPTSPAPVTAAAAGGVLVMTAKVLIPLTVVLAITGAVLWMNTDDGTPDEPGMVDEVGHSGDATPEAGHKAAPLRGTGTGDGEPEAPGAARGPSADRTPAAPAEPAFRAPAGFEAGEGRIVGRVVDPEGKPVDEAPVRVRGQLVVDGTVRAYEQTVHTDAAGWFRIDDVPKNASRPYQIAVAPTDGRRARGRSNPGDVPGRLVVQPPATLTGKLVGETIDVPVEGIGLRLRREGAPSAEQGTITHSGADGVFQFADLFPGRYVLTLYRFDSNDGSRPVMQLYPIRVDRITVPGEPLEVPVRQGLVIAGEVRGPDGTPLGVPIGVELLGQTENGDTDYSRRRRITINDGRFRFVGLAEGRYLLAFEPQKGTEGTALPLAARTVEGVAAGTEDLLVDLHQGRTIHGYIAGPDGAETNAKGYLCFHKPGEPAGGPSAVVVSVNNKSRFRTGPLDPGQSYNVLVSAFDGYMDQRLEGIYPGDQEVVIKLTKAVRISGKVQASDGSTLPAYVPLVAHAAPKHAAEPGANRAGHAGPDGRFTLDGLGEFRYTVSAGGGRSGMVCDGVVTDVEAGRTDVVIKVKRGVAFSGRLVDQDGNPVKTSRMGGHAVEHVGGIDFTTGIDGEDGRFVFAGVPAGKVRLWAYIGGEYVRLGTFTAPATDVEVRLPER